MARTISRRFPFAYQTPALVGALALLSATLGGCGGHGKYTTEHINIAQEKMAVIKSGTDWQMAQQQFLGGDLNKSLKSVDRSLANNPRVPKSHLLRGRILLEMGRIEEARQSFLAVESLDPNFVEAHYYLGIIHERVAEPDQALARYKTAMDLDTANAQYLIAASEMLVTLNRLDEAEQLLNERRQYFTYNAAVRQTLGHIAMLRNDPAAAAANFNEALLLAPGDMQIVENLAQAQFQARQYADAEVNVTRILDSETGKERRDLKHLKARCLIALDRPVEARTLLIELTSDKEGGRDVRGWIELGNVAVLLKDKINLRQAAARVQAMAPEKAEGFMLRAMYCRMDNRPEDALQAAENAITRAVEDPTAYRLKALVLKDLGRIAESDSVIALANSLAANRTIVGHPDASN